MVRPRSPSRRDDPTRTVARTPARYQLGAILRVHGATGSPAQFRLTSGSCIIGAGAGAHLAVTEPTVSRNHVELTLVPEGVAVRDLGSRNGTYYLGQRVERIVLALGSRLRIGSVAELSIDADVDALGEDLSEGARSYRGLVGASGAMRRLFAILSRLEGSLVNVLVQGQSGVGKELVARAIHEGSPLCAAPLVVVNCAGIARELILSELFGHRRGAFTGAIEHHVGAFEAADGGTLFLDEIGELPLDVQPALLRALQSGEVRPVGETEAKLVNVRIVAATNRNLEDEVRAGRFRGDLYYRLAVVKLAVPSLQERPEDIGLLAEVFARATGLARLPPEIVEELSRRAWPGNARELRNAVEAYVALGTIPDDSAAPSLPVLDFALRQLIDTKKPYADLKDVVMERFTRNYLRVLLAEAGGNQSQAARVSGIERSYLGKLLVKHGIVKP